MITSMKLVMGIGVNTAMQRRPMIGLIDMTDRIRIDMACNNPDNGAFVGRVAQLQVAGGALEMTAKAWNITSFANCPKLDESHRHIVLSSKRWPILHSRDWLGNWCWNAYWLEASIGIEFLTWLHARAKFHVEGGWCDLCDAWALSPPLKLDEGMRVRLVEESQRG